MFKNLKILFALCFYSLSCSETQAKPEVLFSQQSEYGLIEVVDLFSKDTLYVCVDKDYRLTFSSFSKDDQTIMASEYDTFASNGISINPNIEKILILGLGAGEFLGYMTSYLKTVSVKAIEINPVLISIVKDFRKLKPKNTELIQGDAFKYISETKEKFDLIFSDIYLTKPNAAEEFKDFSKKIKNILSQNGILVFNAFVPFTPKSLVEDLLKQFDNVTAQVTQMGYNVVFICYQGKQKTKEELLKNATEMQKKYKFRYSLPELTMKMSHIKPENQNEWINKFPASGSMSFLDKLN